MGTNALSTKTVIAGSSAYSNVGTVNFGTAGDYTANSFGNSTTSGNNLAMTNSSGGVVNLTFTNANNYFTLGNNGGKILTNSSANLNILFNGGVDIGSSEANDNTFTGDGNFRINGAVTSTGVGVRALTKSGAGTLTLAGAGNNYKGTTAVNGGTLEVGAEGALPSTNSITVSGGATLKFNQSSGGISVGAMTVAGTLEQKLVTISSSGNVNLDGATLIVTEDTSANEIEYTLIRVEDGNSVSGTLSSSTIPSGYDLRIDTTSVKLVKSDVVIGGSTFDATYTPGSEEAVGPNGLKNLMNYALGGTASNPSPELPVLTVGASGLTLTANIRNDDNSGLTVDGEYADSLEGPWYEVKQEEWNPDANSSVPYLTVRSFTRAFGSQPRQFLRFRVTK